MSTRLADTFAALSSSGRKGLICFITCGDPHPGLTVDVMHALVAQGVDAIELGMPFSDPMADGPVIEKASERAIAKGTDLPTVLKTVAAFRETNQHTPVVLMGYLNPILQYERAKFVADAKQADADALLVVDCPIEESVLSNAAQGGGFKAELNAQGLQQIFLLAPTSSPARAERMAAYAEGFLYYVSVAGITGAQNLDTRLVAEAVKSLKKLTKVPVAVGFGVKDALSAKAVAESADAVVIGSALVNLLAPCQNKTEIENAVSAFIGPIRVALDAADFAKAS